MTTTPTTAREHPEAARLLRVLSPREAQVLTMLATGTDLQAIAKELGIAATTARSHLNRGMRKLGMRTREEALALAAVLVSPVPASPAPPPPGAKRPDAPTPGAVALEAVALDAASARPVPPEAVASGSAAATTSPADVPKGESPEAGDGPEAGEGPEDASWAPESPAIAEPTGTAGAPKALKDANGILFDPIDGPPVRPQLVFADFDALCTVTHTRLVQQTFLLTGCRHRAVHVVHLALGVAGRRWREVSQLPDPERWVRMFAFDTALSPWRRGGPRRTRRLWHLPRPRIRVHPAGEDQPPHPDQDRLTARDRALLKALRRLSRPQRRALVLHDSLGLPAPEVAAEVESSTAAAEARVRAARAELVRSVPDLVGTDASAPGFGEQLATLLHRAAVHGCPAPRRPSPLRLKVQGRLRSGLQGASAGLVVSVVGTAIVLVGSGYSPSRLMQPPAPVPPPLCTGPGSGSAGPLLPDGEPGLRTVWCGPTPGHPVPLVAPPPLRVRPPKVPPVGLQPPGRPARTTAGAAGAAGGAGGSAGAAGKQNPSSAEQVQQPQSALPVGVPAVQCGQLRLCPAAAPSNPPLPIWPTAWEW
ncbi:sigma factor-like helix-turn-helix DNA-binding protein [Saccharothrix sp. ST-888]|uniref:sigma factor-like helix-turn-helix DNA-binding protein n=1 Tax=Saccharothrix sp. ST-888 TaxID=1427391 RepID=UPI000AC31BA2|nr:sigma factor-like helix-turn-helix DNA-binding protein [Saccharothrix sp. ST-888]